MVSLGNKPSLLECTPQGMFTASILQGTIIWQMIYFLKLWIPDFFFFVLTNTCVHSKRIFLDMKWTTSLHLGFKINIKGLHSSYNIVLCCWVRHLTLSVTLSIQEYNWLPINPFYPNISRHILHTVHDTFLVVLTRSKENLFNNQEFLLLVIISIILMTLMFDSVVIL